MKHLCLVWYQIILREYPDFDELWLLKYSDWNFYFHAVSFSRFFHFSSSYQPDLTSFPTVFFNKQNFPKKTRSRSGEKLLQIVNAGTTAWPQAHLKSRCKVLRKVPGCSYNDQNIVSETAPPPLIQIIQTDESKKLIQDIDSTSSISTSSHRSRSRTGSISIKNTKKRPGKVGTVLASVSRKNMRPVSLVKCRWGA